MAEGARSRVISRKNQRVLQKRAPWVDESTNRSDRHRDASASAAATAGRRRRTSNGNASSLDAQRRQGQAITRAAGDRRGASMNTHRMRGLRGVNRLDSGSPRRSQSCTASDRLTPSSVVAFQTATALLPRLSTSIRSNSWHTQGPRIERRVVEDPVHLVHRLLDEL